jgi:hypothetical protein
LRVATNLIKGGATVRSPSEGNYDWCGEKDGLQFEVECKSISNDKGRRVHKRDSLMFAGLVRKDLDKVLAKMRGGLIVHVSVPERFPSEYTAQKRLAAVVKRAILSAQDVNDVEADVTLIQFSIADSPMQGPDVSEDALRAFIKRRLGIADARTVATYKPGERALLLVIDSRTPDSLLEESFNSIKDAATRQLTGGRPGIICVKFEGVSADDLVSLAEHGDDTSALRVRTSRFLQRNDIDHLANIAFMADGPIVDQGSRGFSRGGAIYYFDNKKSRFASDARLRIFDEESVRREEI